MGIHERDYYREETQGAFLNGSWTAVGTIVFINVVVYLAVFLFPGYELNSYLALHADLFQSGHIWELLTHGFAHSKATIWHIVFNMFVLWMFGRYVEGIYGKKLFWELYLSLIVLAGLCWVLTQNLVFHVYHPAMNAVGASGAVMGVMLIYILHFPKRTIFIFGILPAPAWVVGVLVLGFDLIQFFQTTSGLHTGVAHSAHLAGALFGYVFYRWHVTLFSFLPTHWLPRIRGWVRGGRRPKLRVVSEADDAQEDLDDQVDRILAKISRYGTDSLTDEEQRVLEAASRRAQKRRGVRSD